MLKVAVLVSGGGTNLQAIIDGIENGSITNAKIDVVISNNKNAYALERAKKHDIEAVALSPKDFETRDLFNEALYNELVDRKIDLIVLAGCLVVIPEKIIHEFENRIINIHPSLIPSFCGTGYYGRFMRKPWQGELKFLEQPFILSMKERIQVRSLPRRQ